MTHSSRGRLGWSAFVGLVALAVVAPVLAVLVDGASSGAPDLPPRIGAMVLTTIGLMLGVAVGTLVIGCGLAWLVTAYSFPLRNAMVWVLVLPLAMPAYILGFTFLATFDRAGPVQGAARSLFGDGFSVGIESLPGCIAVMSLTLYPYVFLMARAAFIEQAPTTYDAARVLGASRTRAFFRVLLPLARPSLAAGVALVLMEVLTDFATIQYFGVETVSYGVYLVWNQTYDFASAAQLASLVLGFAVAVIAGERLLRGRAAFTQRGGRGIGSSRTPLPRGRGFLALGVCLAVLAVSVGIPVLRLVLWSLEPAARGFTLADPALREAVGNSVFVALTTAVICVTVAVLVGHALRIGGGRLVRAAAQLSTFGYAVPGAVIAIGVLLLLKYLDTGLESLGVEDGTGLLATGSVAGVLIAYAVRFLAPAQQSVDASFAKVAPAMTHSALSLGAGPVRVLGRVHLAMVRPGIAVATVLVTVDAIKELPLMLLLRPFGFTTTSVWVYQRATENLWEQAAMPALLIVLLASIAVFALSRHIRRADQAAEAML